MAAFAALVVTPSIAGLFVGFHNMALVPIAVGTVGLTFVVDRIASPIVDRWHRGAVGEEHVGEIIDGLREQAGSRSTTRRPVAGTLTTFSSGRPGLFTVETKSHGGRIDPGRIDEAMLSQAYAQSKAVEDITRLAVEPLLVFSRAYLVGHAVARSRGVTILPARMLARFLASRPHGHSRSPRRCGTCPLGDRPRRPYIGIATRFPRNVGRNGHAELRSGDAARDLEQLLGHWNGQPPGECDGSFAAMVDIAHGSEE